MRIPIVSGAVRMLTGLASGVMLLVPLLPFAYGGLQWAFIIAAGVCWVAVAAQMILSVSGRSSPRWTWALRPARLGAAIAAGVVMLAIGLFVWVANR